MDRVDIQPDDIIVVYVPCATIREAENIGKTLVLDGIIACANILPGVQSIYLWQGKLEQSKEVLLLVKTTGKHTERIKEKIASIHSYSIPCIATIRLESINEPYAQWLLNAVAS